MSETAAEKRWYVMRDLRRRTANVLAYQELQAEGLEVFTPLTEMLMAIHGQRRRRTVPVIQDLLFVHETKERLDSYVALMPNLQYRYVRGRSINDPLTVRDADMQQFMRAVSATDDTRYYLPGELTEAMYGRQVRIIGGPLDNCTGKLLSVKGMRTRRLIVEIPGLISASVAVNPDYIQFLPKE